MLKIIVQMPFLGDRHRKLERYPRMCVDFAVRKVSPSRMCVDFAAQICVPNSNSSCQSILTCVLSVSVVGKVLSEPHENGSRIVLVACENKICVR